MRIPHIPACLLGALLPGLIESREVTQFEYLAYSRGMSAGVASVRVLRDEGRYEIHGEAEAKGFIGWLSRWNSRFEVVGYLHYGEPVVEYYEHMEANRSRVKEVQVERGTIRYVRNGEEREPRAAVAPLDVFSLMFVAGECKDVVRAHSGLMGYDLRLVTQNIEGRIEKCVYSAVDDEGDQFEAMVWIESVEGMRVPTRLDIEGYGLGVFVLDQAHTIPSDSEMQMEVRKGDQEG